MQATYNPDYFEQLYRLNNGDPWGYQAHWYEQRKRDITLAVLPAAKFQLALEIGCSNGILSEALATRCETLTCLDGCSSAVKLAKKRLATWVDVQQAVIPQQLPQQQYDLIVVSEVLYYLNQAELNTTMQWLNQALHPQGCIVACHWLQPIEGFALNGRFVHQQLKQALNYSHSLTLQDQDFYLDVWRHSDQTLAEQEGLR